MDGVTIGHGVIYDISDKMMICISDKLKNRTLFSSIDKDVISRYVEESKRTSKSLLDVDNRRIKEWISEVVLNGIERTIENRVWGDHALGMKDSFKGKRSVRLSELGRIIYKIDQKISADTIISTITIIRITSSHDYSVD
jgi:hypothetical protein